MVSSALLRSCARVLSSLATSAGILSAAFAMIVRGGASAAKSAPRARLTVRRQPVDISVVAFIGAPADFFLNADMAELADALGSGPSDRKVVEVRVLLSAPTSAAGF